MGEAVTTDQLELAVSGLAGLLGALILATGLAWVRVLGQWLESGYAALGRNPRVSGRWALVAVGLTLLTVFNLYCLGRAAGEVREVRVEAPLFAPILEGLGFGFVACLLYVGALVRFRRQWRGRRPAWR